MARRYLGRVHFGSKAAREIRNMKKPKNYNDGLIILGLFIISLLLTSVILGAVSG